MTDIDETDIDIDEVKNSICNEVIALGNEIAHRDRRISYLDVADGLLLGVLQYWLFSRKPCGKPDCKHCDDIPKDAEGRMQELDALVKEMSSGSYYFHNTTDPLAGNA